MRYYRCARGHRWKPPFLLCPKCGRSWAVTFRVKKEEMIEPLEEALKILAGSYKGNEHE